MPALLFEIGCEELPAKALEESRLQIPELCRIHLAGQPSDLYLSPRRIGFFIPDIPERTPDEWVKGPPESLRDKAAVGFAKRHGVSVDGLTLRDGFLGVEVPGKHVRAVLPEALAEIVRGLQFSKSMRWPGASFRFARPVRWLCAKLDDESIVLDLDNIPSGGFSFGHRFTHDERVEILHARAYRDTLLAVDVDPDRANRYMEITAGLDRLGRWTDPGLVLDEVVYLVEKPEVLEGRFDDKFLKLPDRVVVTTMQSHQRYFALGRNRFAVVTNGGDPATTIRGYEQVLTARLEDAAFTFERDVQVGIIGLAERLHAVTYIDGAGTLADKAVRLVGLVRFLAAQNESAATAARLCKADLASELVREFPELQGYIGSNYARLAGYDDIVCKAIEEHYWPTGANEPLPSTAESQAVSVADKLDSLVVAFALGRRPTGSADPFALRRAALGLCRMALRGPTLLDVERLAAIALRQLAEQQPELDVKATGKDVADFVIKRLEGLIDFPVEYLRAVHATGLTELSALYGLASLLATTDSVVLTKLREAYVRALNLASDASSESVDPSLLRERAERQLFEQLRGKRQLIEGAIANYRFSHAIEIAVDLADPLDEFFREVLVMDPDEQIRRNRLALLQLVVDTLGAIGDLSQIPL